MFRLKMTLLAKNFRGNWKLQVYLSLPSCYFYHTCALENYYLSLNMQISHELFFMFHGACARLFVFFLVMTLITNKFNRIVMSEKELKEVRELFSQAADNCLNLKKPD